MILLREQKKTSSLRKERAPGRETTEQYKYEKGENRRDTGSGDIEL